MEVGIAVDGSAAEAAALWDWLRQEPELRGRLRFRPAPAPEGAMGSATELWVQGAVAVAGAGALWAALARSLSVWLTQRRSDLTVRVTVPGGRQVYLNAKRVNDPQYLLREILAASGSAVPEAGADVVPADTGDSAAGTREP